jgi:hypothetical protein
MSAFVVAVGVLGVLIGVGAVLRCAVGVASYRRMSARATGTVIGSDDLNGVQLVPVVAFMPLQGPETRFSGGNDMGLFGPRIGQSVPVRYDPRDPAKARIATFYMSYLSQGFCLLLGIATGVICLIGLVR